jgi:lipopolysaccharide export system ATP-binding protein
MALEAKGLVKSYSGRRVVNWVSLDVEQGKVVGLLGPNGAGKTTTFYMMIGFIAAERGAVLLEGEDISTLPFYRRARLGIGYLPQEPSVFVRASVMKNLDLVLECSADSGETVQIRERLLDEFGLVSLRARQAGTLSAGERRRVEIARSLATSPSYILLDEPFSGIDPLSVAELQQQIVTLKERGIGLIATDHNVRDTLSITDYAYLINEGKVITSGTPGEILDDPLARRFYLGERFQA